MSKRVRGAPGDVESPGNLSSGGGHCIGLGGYININHQPKLPISKSHEGPEGGEGERKGEHSLLHFGLHNSNPV